MAESTAPVCAGADHDGVSSGCHHFPTYKQQQQQQK